MEVVTIRDPVELVTLIDPGTGTGAGKGTGTAVGPEGVAVIKGDCR